MTHGEGTVPYSVGNVAHDGVDSGNPVKIGGIARQANPTAVAALDRADLYMDDVGRPSIVLNVPRDLVGAPTVTTITASTTETTVLAAAASTFNDVYAVLVSNTSATASRVDFRDATAGTIRFTIYVPAGDTKGISFGGAIIPQTTANNNWTAQCSASVTDIRITVFWVKNV